jgi:hypothetical protein
MFHFQLERTGRQCAIAIFQPANADDHQVTTGILLEGALGDAKGHYLSGWTETTSRIPPSANYRDYILKIHRLASSGATDLTGPGLYRLASGGQ